MSDRLKETKAIISESNRSEVLEHISVLYRELVISDWRYDFSAVTFVYSDRLTVAFP